MPLKQKLLIMHQGAIGDLILSLPALHAIRTAFPAHHVEALGYPRILSLIHQRFYADTVVSIDRAMFAPLYRDEGMPDPGLSAFFSDCDRIFVFGGQAQDPAAKNISSMTTAPVFKISPFPGAGNIHVVDFQIQQLRRSGIEARSAVPALFPTTEDRMRASCVLADSGMRASGTMLVTAHPGSGSSRKNWPAAYFADLIQYIAARQECCIMLVKGPADDEPCSALEQTLAGMPLFIVRQPELVLLAGLLQNCRLYIGNDSGITHMAAALGVPTIALFGPTDPAVWGPRGKRVRILRGSDDRQGWAWPSVDAVAQEAFALLRDSVS